MQLPALTTLLARQWPWLGVTVFVAGALWLYGLRIPQIAAETVSSQRMIDRLQSAARAPQAKQARDDSAASLLDALPAAAASNDVVSRVTALAKKEGVSLGSVTVQKPDVADKTGVDRLELNGRLTGQYPKIKAVLSQLLVEVPTLAMTSVSMRQSQLQVEAEVQWYLYVKAER
jgi:Type II secretion system (T2SS), protein M subtype b